MINNDITIKAIIVSVFFSFNVSAQSNESVQKCSVAAHQDKNQQTLDICKGQLEKVIAKGDEISKLDIYLELISIYHSLGDKKQQDYYLEKLKSHPLFLQKQKYQYHWNRWLGRIKYHSKEFELSKQHFYDGLGIAVLSNNQQWLMISYNDVGMIEKKLGKLNEALYYYNKSLRISKTDNDLYRIGQTLLNIAVVYFELEEFDNADKFFDRTLDYFDDYTKTENYDKRVHKSIPHVYQYLLVNNIKSGNLTSLDENYRHLMDNFRDNFNTHEQIGMLLTFGRYYLDLSEYRLAQNFLEDALNLEGGESSAYTAQIYYDLSKLYFYQDLKAQASTSAKLAVDFAVLHNDLTIEYQSYKLLSEINNDDLSQSILYLQEYQNKREEFLKIKYDKSVKNMQHQFEKQQIESDLLKSNITNANQKIKIDQLTINSLIIFIILVFISLFLLYFMYKKRIEKKELLESINYHKQQLLILQDDQRHEVDPPTEPPKMDEKTKKLKLKECLVKTMLNALEIWERHTESNRVELADQSKIWTVSIDNGNLRTRSLDKYLSIEKMPKNPRWRNVVRTCHFILTDSSLLADDRAKLEASLADIMQSIESLSL